MRVRLVLGVVGRLVGPFAVAFVPPLLMALVEGNLDQMSQFALAAFTTLMLGKVMVRAGEVDPVLRRAEALAVVTLTWLTVGVVSAIPYLFAGMSAVDAMFESISGLTTTGATVLQGELWQQSKAFFLWRAMTQWFGGLGVIALFVVILPRLGIAGRQIFFFEASTAPSEAVSPSVRRSAAKLWVFYCGLTALMALLLMGVGVPVYESVIHSLTTLCAGGFSNNPESVVTGTGHATAAMQWVMVPFMFLAGASYPLFYAGFIQRSPRSIWRDEEFRLYAWVTLLAVVVLALTIRGDTVEQKLRDSAFQVTSLISSAGFASVDYEAHWGALAKGVLIVVMILGGCAGSAAGGAKQVRFLLMFKFLHRELTRTLHPRAVLSLRHGGEPVPHPVLRAVLTLVLLYVFGYAVVTTGLLLIGGVPIVAEHGTVQAANEELTTAGSAAIACLSNVGPAFGKAGPMGGYAEFPTASKILLTLAMLIGRLEIVTMLALMHPDVWRHISFSKVQRMRVKQWTVFQRDDPADVRSDGPQIPSPAASTLPPMSGEKPPEPEPPETPETAETAETGEKAETAETAETAEPDPQAPASGPTDEPPA